MGPRVRFRCWIIDHNFIYNRANYLEFKHNVLNRYLIIVRKFRNDNFITFWVIKKVRAARKPPPPLGIIGLMYRL